MIATMSGKQFSVGKWFGFTLLLYFLGIPIWFLLEESGLIVLALVLIPALAAGMAFVDNSDNSRPAPWENKQPTAEQEQEARRRAWETFGESETPPET